MDSDFGSPMSASDKYHFESFTLGNNKSGANHCKSRDVRLLSGRFQGFEPPRPPTPPSRRRVCNIDAMHHLEDNVASEESEILVPHNLRSLTQNGDHLHRNPRNKTTEPIMSSKRQQQSLNTWARKSHNGGEHLIPDRIRKVFHDRLNCRVEERNMDVDSDWCRFSDSVLHRNTDAIRRLVPKIEMDIDVAERLTAVVWENLRNPVSNPLMRQETEDVCHPCKRQYLSMHTGRCIHRIVKVYKLLTKCGVNLPLLLHTAVNKEAVEVVKFLLFEAHADVNSCYPLHSRMTPILYALDPASQYGFIQAGEYKRRLCSFSKEDFPRICMEEVISNQDLNVELIETLVHAGANLNYADMDGNAAIHRLGFCKYDSVKHTDIRVLKLLMSSKDININLEGVYGYTPLHIYAMRSAEEEVRLFIDEGANLDAQNEDNDCPIHIALKWGHAKIGMILVKAKCDTNRQGEGGMTPLHYCAQRSDWQNLIIELIHHGAIINITNDKEEAPLHLAIKYPHICMLLIDNGALVNKQRADGSTVLHIFAKLGQYDNVQMMLDADADVNLCTTDGELPLHLAVEYPQILKLLLHSESQGDKQGLGGNTTLHYCSIIGNYDGVQSLLQANVDVNICNDTGDTALHLSVKYPEIIRSLIYNGANVNILNSLNRLALHCAVLELEHSENWTQIIEVMDILVSEGSEVAIQDKSQCIPLHYIATFHHFCKQRSEATFQTKESSLELLRLTRKVVDIDRTTLNYQDSKGNTPLHIAVENGDSELVELFWFLHSDVSIQNKYGQTSIDIARTTHIRDIAPEIVKLLNRETSKPRTSQANSGQVVGALQGLLGVVTCARDKEELQCAIRTIQDMMQKYGTHMDMSMEHVETLKSVRSCLIEEMSPLYVCEALLKEEVIGSDAVSEIRRSGNRRNQCEQLVDFIMQNGDDVFHLFFLALEQTQQSHVAQLICQRAMCHCHRTLSSDRLTYRECNRQHTTESDRSPEEMSYENAHHLVNGTRPSSRGSVL